MSQTIDANLLQQIKNLLRRDLKLGNDIEIADEMSFFESDIDVDSLDILMIVGSIEKQFGVKISSEHVGREAFENVASLARFVEKHRAVHAPLPAESPANTDWLSKLPHGPEFRFVSQVSSVVRGDHAVGDWKITGDEAFLAGHFPGNPLVPGVLLTEALAQLSGFTSQQTPRAALLVHTDMRFLKPVRPPVTIELRAKVMTQMGSLQTCEVSARVHQEVVARGTITLHFGDPSTGQSQA